MSDLFNNNKNKFYCPLCNKCWQISEFLQKTFNDNDKALWFSNMVTHYRHEHITSWNKCWGYNGQYYRSKWFKDYDSEKAKVNERAKRQIIRKAKDFMIKYEIGVETVKKLKGYDSKTIELANEKLHTSLLTGDTVEK